MNFTPVVTSVAGVFNTDLANGMEPIQCYIQSSCMSTYSYNHHSHNAFICIINKLVKPAIQDTYKRLKHTIYLDSMATKTLYRDIICNRYNDWSVYVRLPIRTNKI